MKIIRVETSQYRDEIGDLEEFSKDLFPVVESTKTNHLAENGLPLIGTKLRPGMIIVGKIGKTKNFDPKRQPSCLEIHGLPLEKLQTKYGDMWQDLSLYATSQVYGSVIKAYFEKTSTSLKAVVEIEQ
jgi:DNA-directed RNA polymerase beta subunit